jgi:hypothetical protein
MLYRFVSALFFSLQLAASSYPPSQSERDIKRTTEDISTLPGAIPSTEQHTPSAPPPRTQRTVQEDDIRKKILAASADPATLNAIFITAAKNGHANLVELALKTGADINTVDSNGFTAIHYAVARIPETTTLTAYSRENTQNYRNYMRIIVLLLEARANLSIPTISRYDARTVVETIIHREQTELIYLFARYGAVFPEHNKSDQKPKRQSSFSDLHSTVQVIVANQMATASKLGEIARKSQLAQRKKLIEATIPSLPTDLTPLIQEYAGVPHEDIDPIEINRQIQQLESDNDCSCTIL